MLEPRGFKPCGAWSMDRRSAESDLRLAAYDLSHRADDLLDRHLLGEHHVRPRLLGPSALYQVLASGKRQYRDIGLGLVQLFNQFASVPVRQVKGNNG